MLDQNSAKNTNDSFRAKLDRILELLVGSSFGAAIIYSLFWGAFQSLADIVSLKFTDTDAAIVGHALWFHRPRSG